MGKTRLNFEYTVLFILQFQLSNQKIQMPLPVCPYGDYRRYDCDGLGPVSWWEGAEVLEEES
ncbi:hypothetical protein SLEP1_g30344 [Rubroshorea leprosula]|uniref:Uncharacterized protein n=1 Tax=Rubroshorea leprosula TaxID=152421 RepID=A0AAV5K919_9ROSI|nr:hypothetical protein SLEP1_g30344 [Rubroshorea leprosula]